MDLKNVFCNLSNKSVNPERAGFSLEQTLGLPLYK